MRRRHRILVGLPLCRLKAPRRVLDLRPVNAPLILAVQAVALRQPPFERPRLRLEWLPDRAVCRPQRRSRRAAMHPLAPVAHRFAILQALDRHLRVEVRQKERLARRPYRQHIARVQAEEPHARLVVGGNVGPHVQFGKGRNPRHCGGEARSDVTHPERHDPHPRLSVDHVQRQPRWDARSQHIRIDGPVREDQLVPRLSHCPGAVGQRVGAVLYRGKGIRHVDTPHELGGPIRRPIMECIEERSVFPRCPSVLLRHKIPRRRVLLPYPCFDDLADRFHREVALLVAVVKMRRNPDSGVRSVVDHDIPRQQFA